MGAALINAARTWLLKHGAPDGTLRNVVLRRCKHFVEDYAIEPILARVGGWAPKVCPTLDIYRSETLNHTLKECGGAPLVWTPRDVARSDLDAARFALGLLQERPALRQNFPQAVGEGVDGRYCRWLCSSARVEFALSAAAVDSIKAAFARRLGQRPRSVYDHNVRLRRLIPLALTPAGQRQFLAWLLWCGKRKYGLLDEEIWWFTFEAAEDPRRGVAATYLRTPEWQEKFPLGLTVFGQADLLTWIASRYRIRERWLEQVDLCGILSPLEELRLLHAGNPALQAAVPGAFSNRAETRRLASQVRSDVALAPPRRLWWDRLEGCLDQGQGETRGVNVLGHFCYPAGLGEAAHFMVRALQRAGLATACRNVPTNINTDVGEHGSCLGLEIYDCTLIAVPPEPNLDGCFLQSGLAPAADKHRIGVWYSELEAAPRRWARHVRLLQEIWAPTRFIARALRAVMPIPVIDMLPGVELGAAPTLGRSHFGLSDRRFLFLFMFDMWSVMERKNPLGLIRAFRQAFRPEDPVSLVIKIARGHLDPEGLATVRQAAAEAGAEVIDSVMSREESYALIECCDCYVSLHRSEGFGLTMAEAMLMGKPTIATGYSGNLDFMTADNSLLVDFTRVPIARRLPNYPRGSLWAEPSTDRAAAHMRWVFENPEQSRALGARAQQETKQLLSLDAAGQRMARRLQAIGARSAATALAA